MSEHPSPGAPEGPPPPEARGDGSATPASPNHPLRSSVAPLGPVPSTVEAGAAEPSPTRAPVGGGVPGDPRTRASAGSFLAPRLFDYWVTVYRRTWKGSAITSFVTPLLYVLAMGVLLGGFIKGDPAKLEGATSYLMFVAPGMVAAQSMTIVFGEMTYPVMGMIKWNKTYFSMIATPLSVRDVVVAQLGFVTFRVGLVSAVFLLVMAPFGVFTSVGGVLLAFLAQLLIGLAFATPLFALTAFFQSESGFSLVFRLGMIPMFLFSGAFFPVSNLDPVLEAVAKLTPLWHGVDLTRMFTLGTVDGVMVLVHVVYLGTFAVVGFLLVGRLLRKRLVS